jgi:hypothetical protein
VGGEIVTAYAAAAVSAKIEAKRRTVLISKAPGERIYGAFFRHTFQGTANAAHPARALASS